jgi:hypothetical protein
MKITQYLYIMNPVDYLRGDEPNLALTAYNGDIDGWVNCGAITLDVAISDEVIMRTALALLDKAETKLTEELREKLATLKQQRQELLCLTSI